MRQQVVADIAADQGGLERGVDIAKLAARSFENDYGSKDFGGACPPPGHGMHRYQFTVWALPEAELSVPDNASAALVGIC